MVNLVKTLINHIESNIENVEIYMDMFPTDSFDGVIAVHDPATRKESEFIDGSGEYQLNVSFTSRYQDAEECRNILDSILNLIDGLKLTDTTDNISFKISTSAQVQFVGTDDKERSIYTCSVAVDYFKR